MSIRLLDSTLINQIAAGEVIERPASAIKELVENSLDAGAQSVTIQIREGGRTFISITDDGIGMNLDDLVMCVERHATSKIPDQDLFNIQTLGFRGEALPSIGAVSRLNITTKSMNSDNGWQLTVEGGLKNEPTPVPFVQGTRIEVRDLFFATPARLKFLKSARTEQTYIIDQINRLAMANPGVHFKLIDNDRTVLDYPRYDGKNAYEMRLKDIMGQEFFENSIPILLDREGIRIHGLCSLPTYNRSNAQSQYLFVNGRSVKDKLINTAVRVSYQDFLPSNRHPLMALYLKIEPQEVDINVHPAKAEVRFRDTQMVRGMIIAAVKSALDQASNRMATTISDKAVAAFSYAASPQESIDENGEIQTNGIQNDLKTYPLNTQLFDQPVRQAPQNSGAIPFNRAKTTFGASSSSSWGGGGRNISNATQRAMDFQFSVVQTGNLAAQQEPNNQRLDAAPHPNVYVLNENSAPNPDYPLGLAKAQVHKTYIIAQKKDGLVIVDQHAAHERLVYEKLKQQFYDNQIQSQPLLIPQVLTLSEPEMDVLGAHLDDLKQLGLVIEPFGTHEVLIREIPALMGATDCSQLIHDLIGEIQEFGQGVSLKEHLQEMLGTIACHHSIRSGRSLSVDEMNALLRQIESTPHSSQCNHGRPTYITLDLKDIEKLFGRR